MEFLFLRHLQYLFSSSIRVPHIYPLHTFSSTISPPLKPQNWEGKERLSQWSKWLSQANVNPQLLCIEYVYHKMQVISSWSWVKKPKDTGELVNIKIAWKKRMFIPPRYGIQYLEFVTNPYGSKPHLIDGLLHLQTLSKSYWSFQNQEISTGGSPKKMAKSIFPGSFRWYLSRVLSAFPRCSTSFYPFLW